MDTSQIEKRFLKENQLIGLGFPKQGFVFFRVTAVEEIIYHDYEESPGAIAADTFENSARLPISAFSIDNLLRVEKCNHLYQVFMGWQPGAVRQYAYYPYETARRNLDVKTVYTKAPFGYLTGFDSTYDTPSPTTELFIPIDVEVGFGWWNPLSEAVTVELQILIRKLEVDVIRDPELIMRILSGQQPCRLTTIGGVEGSLSYDAPSSLDVNFVKLGSTREEVEAAVR